MKYCVLYCSVISCTFLYSIVLFCIIYCAVLCIPVFKINTVLYFSAMKYDYILLTINSTLFNIITKTIHTSRNIPLTTVTATIYLQQSLPVHYTNCNHIHLCKLTTVTKIPPMYQSTLITMVN